jgi:hypothetical protein
VVVLAIAVIAAVAGTLLWWRRLAGPGPRAILLRILALSALQVSVISFIFVLVNRSAEFYSSWSDLLGTDHGGGAIVAVGLHASRPAAPVRVISAAPVPMPAVQAVRTGHGRDQGRGESRAQDRAGGGRLEAVRIHGQLSGLSAPGYVYLPPRRPAARGGTVPDQGRRLPVIVVISDQLASKDAVYGAQRLAATAAAQIAAGRLTPVLLVMLPARIGGPGGAADQGCLDLPGGVQAGTFFSQDLPEAVQSAYHAVRTPGSAAGGAARVVPGGWALLGDAAGGYCSLQLAMSSSQVFSAVAVPPADYALPPGQAESGGSAQIRTQDDLLWRLGHQPMQPISVLFTGLGQGQQFLSLVRPPMRAESISRPAGKWPLAPVLDWIGKSIGSHS